MIFRISIIMMITITIDINYEQVNSNNTIQYNRAPIPNWIQSQHRAPNSIIISTSVIAFSSYHRNVFSSFLNLFRNLNQMLMILHEITLLKVTAWIKEYADNTFWASLLLGPAYIWKPTNCQSYFRWPKMFK